MTNASSPLLQPRAEQLSWIGRYRVEAAIGEGAMAYVYRAHDPSIHRPLAIKVLKPEFRNDSEVVHRFLAESRAAGMLSHSNIVTIYDVGEADGVPYIAMEHLRGCPLDELLTNEGAMTIERVLALGVQIAGALAYAHQCGVVHRDIKPSNILICDDGRTAKLLDFGIARVDARDDARGAQDAQRTQAGQVMGTPRYMSPEQAMGIPLDARSDLFSLGAVFYEMVAGKPAFRGAGLATLAIQITQQQPAPIEQEVSSCPRGLKFIIGKLLAKKPEDRFSDAALLRQALLREQEALAQHVESRRRGLALRIKLPLTLAATAAVALLLSVGLVLDRQNETMVAMAVKSGASMTEFVARNVALRVADNAGLPAAEQDWLPLQAFVETAAKDKGVRHLIVADDHGLVRAAGDSALVGTSYRAPAHGADGFTDVRDDGIRLVRTVQYAGADFGKVDITLDRSDLDAAMARTRILLIALSCFVIAVVAGIGFLSARQLSMPIRRLRNAMEDVAQGNLHFRLSHRRNDEMGRLFDTFNTMAGELDARTGPGGPVAEAQAMLRTRIGAAAENREVA
ncbi:MAG: protein kinase [Sphingobium sp.]|uniref:protein kinase domain-containing protein n=1 Tax=Sphingobium sp. TaxID=1912891 RepID=UPI0029B65BF7|nr:protein kinase [Sphingobium sp.]MDX3909614.1 protein kinase [Sphingobium sp.]